MMCIADVADYLSLVRSGRLYDTMLGELRAHSIDRETLKRGLLRDVIAKRGAYRSIIEDTFRRLFPTVYAFVRRINREGAEHSNLIRLLQRAESELVIETVADDLVTRYPRTFFLTLHDAIYSPREDLRKVEQAFGRAFDRTGFQMTIKVAF